MDKFVNLKTLEGVNLTLFPDNQPHVQLAGIREDDKVFVTASIQSSLDLIHVVQVANAIDNMGAEKAGLRVTYLMGARYDRSMAYGDSVDLKVFAQIINSCGFKRVGIVDPHSPTALQLIDNSTEITNHQLVKFYSKQNAVLICPDAGATKKIENYLQWNPNLRDVIYCIKHRDQDGGVSLRVLEPQKTVGRNCVIIDDICDGGATFLAIAQQIVPKHLTLMVTHGIFSKGMSKLKESFDEIITTNSYRRTNENPKFPTVIQL